MVVVGPVIALGDGGVGLDKVRAAVGITDVPAASRGALVIVVVPVQVRGDQGPDAIATQGNTGWMTGIDELKFKRLGRSTQNPSLASLLLDHLLPLFGIRGVPTARR